MNGSRVSDGFLAFWTAYPKKKAKHEALKAWTHHSPTEQLQGQILAALERAMTSEEWAKDGGRYIPYPATWLRGKRWEDEVTQPTIPEPKGFAVLRTLRAKEGKTT